MRAKRAQASERASEGTNTHIHSLILRTETTQIVIKKRRANNEKGEDEEEIGNAYASSTSIASY